MSPIEHKLLNVLEGYLSRIVARAAVRLAMSKAGTNVDRIQVSSQEAMVKALALGLRSYIRDIHKRNECINKLRIVLAQHYGTAKVEAVCLEVAVKGDSDIVTARSAGRNAAQRLGFSASDSLKTATAISELARNIVPYASSGQLTIHTNSTGGRAYIEVRAVDSCPGIEDVELVLSGRYQSRTGMGRGLSETRKLVDEFDIKTAAGEGTTATIRKYVR